MGVASDNWRWELLVIKGDGVASQNSRPIKNLGIYSSNRSSGSIVIIGNEVA